jgi:hypothetical protein
MSESITPCVVAELVWIHLVITRGLNVATESSQSLARTLPPIVTQQLVPGVWKEKWEPMRPFLLP